MKTNKKLGEEVVDYCSQYLGTEKYNTAMLAIEKGYELGTQDSKLCLDRSIIMYSKEEVINLIEKAITHKANKDIGSLVTVDRELRTANFFSWIKKHLK